MDERKKIKIISPSTATKINSRDRGIAHTLPSEPIGQLDAHSSVISNDIGATNNDTFQSLIDLNSIFLINRKN